MKTRYPKHGMVLVALGALAILPYLVFLNLPFIADDYPVIALAREYGPVNGWPALAADPLYRCRATSLVLTYCIERLFGSGWLTFNWTSVFFHVVNTWLVLALGVWPVVGWRVSTVAAAFFAIYHGHGEAVIWYSALPELLVFFFSLLTLLCWVLWLKSSRAVYYAGSLLLFSLALLSKESAVAVVPLLVVVWAFKRQDRHWRLIGVVPFLVLALVYGWAIFASRSDHLHFRDGTFSLQAPFLATLWRGSGRLFWIWGLFSLIALLFWRALRSWSRLLAWAFFWIAITLLPYSFLTYMPYVPSRHTYWPSAGLALVVAVGVLTLRERLKTVHPWAAITVALLILVHQCGYLWVVKRPQYIRRAASTEALVELARRTEGPVYMHCFPYSPVVAELAVEFRLEKPREILIWDAEEARSMKASAVFCWNAWRGRRCSNAFEQRRSPVSRGRFPSGVGRGSL